MKRVRKVEQNMTETRKLAENNVRAYNPNLNGRVAFMGISELLANTHPLDRKTFARGFKEEGILPYEVAEEYGLLNYKPNE